MRSVILSVIAAAGLSHAAHAATTVQMLVSTDGVNFLPSVNVMPGTTVEVLVSVSNTGTAAIGLGSMIFQPTVSNWTALDTLLPFTAPFGGNTTTPTGAVSDTSASTGASAPGPPSTPTPRPASSATPATPASSASPRLS